MQNHFGRGRKAGSQSDSGRLEVSLSNKRKGWLCERLQYNRVFVFVTIQRDTSTKFQPNLFEFETKKRTNLLIMKHSFKKYL